MVQDKYSEYLDSELMWVREYPAHWSLTKVKYEAYVKARVGWHGLKTDDFTDVGPYLVTGSDFKSSVISWKDCYHCDLERYEQDPYIQLQNGDLLLTKDGTIGKIALVQGLKDDEKATLNSGVFVVRPLRNSFITEFYFWLLESSVFKKFVDYHKTGSTIVHLYQGTFVEFSYASPPLDEQAQIANFLDHETAQIDTLIEKQQTLIQLLREKRQAVISHAVTKGLNPDAPMKDSGVEWLGEVPEHWTIIQLKHACELLKDGTHLPPPRVDVGIPLLSVRNVVNGKFIFRGDDSQISERDYNQLSKSFIPQTGDVLLAIVGGTLGKAAVVENMKKFHIQRSLAIFRTNKMKVHNYFLNFLFNSQSFQSLLWENAGFSAQPGIYLGTLSNFLIPMPSAREQIEITNFLNDKVYAFDELIKKAEQAIQLMQERRTALISAAVTGKIDVRGWRAPESKTTLESL